MQSMLLIMAGWIVVSALVAIYSVFLHERLTITPIYVVVFAFYLALEFLLIIGCAVNINAVMHGKTVSAIESWRDAAMTKRWEANLGRRERHETNTVLETRGGERHEAWSALMDGFGQLSNLVKNGCPMQFYGMPIDSATRDRFLQAFVVAASGVIWSMFHSWFTPVPEQALSVESEFGDQ